MLDNECGRQAPSYKLGWTQPLTLATWSISSTLPVVVPNGCCPVCDPSGRLHGPQDRFHVLLGIR